jgi:hypothetical protein
MCNNCVLANPEVRMVARIVGSDKRAENLPTFDIFINSLVSIIHKFILECVPVC